MLCYHCMCEKGDADICPHCHAQGTVELQPHQIAPGTVIGNRYTLGNVIGEGGFGITYIGLENTLGITVAIKEYYPFGYCNRNSTASNTVVVTSDDRQQMFEKGRSRFLKEAKTLAKFQSEPGVVNVIDFLEENNTAYIIMEYLEGITLREYLKQNGNLQPEQAVEMLLPSMRALAKIHSAGVIHRDISPDNIMLLRDCSLKLMDFGAARDYDGVDNRSMSIMLKQGYAPVEQYRRNGEQGPWTDVYGMCATIYRAITGITPVDSIDRVCEDTLRTPSQCGVKITPAMENTLMKGLAVQKENRCPDMNTLIELFEQALKGQDDLTGAAAVAAVGAAAGAAFSDNRTIDPNMTVAADDYHPRYQQSDPRVGQGNQRPPQQGYHPPMQQYPPQQGYRPPVQQYPPQQGYRPPVQQYPPQQPMPKKRSAAPWIVGILAFLAVIATVVVVVVLVTQKNNIDGTSSSIIEADAVETFKMPDLSGLTKEEAVKKLSEMNLTVDTFTEAVSEDQAAGKVFNQVPKADSEITNDTKITLYIARETVTSTPESKKETVADSRKDTVAGSPKATSGNYYSTARTYVEMHAGPSTGSAGLGKIWRGDSVQLIEKTSSSWYRVYDGSVTGYVYAAYLSPDRSDVPSATDPIYVDNDLDDGFLALRASASEDSAKLIEIPCGASMTYMGTIEDHDYVRSDGYHVRWVKVRYNGKEGYVYDYYINDGDD